ncbi:polysaccharide deacetylase family protein [Taibaiella sp. KBW10]|uniref:polysaccharide deacetylase family protein n=1 Tax=Taibaiella sp. KBW10 TaxID=2153357 RepID=UPI000F5B0CDD|nr:polysaccharide deacetylase family protein [Taibaiella sp. KBW10]RQO29703.1 polysaccharide deacetylase family protein [Taibaiella sp. KBW10]
MFLKKIPKWLQRLYPNYTWGIPTEEVPCIYLSFDDGPHPTITPWVLAQLAAYNAKATFFCIGKNVVEYPDVYAQLLAEGHKVGNHSHNHLKGTAYKNNAYIENINRAKQYIDSNLFRPPYGRMKASQGRILKSMGYKIIMWSLIPGDWDKAIAPEDCLENIVFNIEPGNIVVLHDSQKAWDRMSYVLPRLLEHCKQQGWALKVIP